MKTISFRATDEEAEQIRKLAQLVQFPEGQTSVLRKGTRAMWERYGPYAEVLDANREKLAEDARKARTGEGGPTITKIGDTEITINDDGDVMYADLVIENAEGKWYGVHMGGDDWDYLQDNGEYIPVPADA